MFAVADNADIIVRQRSPAVPIPTEMRAVISDPLKPMIATMTKTTTTTTTATAMTMTMTKTVDGMARCTAAKANTTTIVSSFRPVDAKRGKRTTVLSRVPALIRSALLKKSFEMRAGGCYRSFTLLHFQRKFSFREQLERPTISRNSSLISYRSNGLTETQSARSALVGGTIFLQREKERERERISFVAETVCETT